MADNHIEVLIKEIDNRIEKLKVDFNLFFSGEIKLPPEKERVEIEGQVRNLLYTVQKSPKINLLIQNIASKFSLYNNLWLKKMNEIEAGMNMPLKKIKDIGKKRIKKEEKHLIQVSLNIEDSFDNLYSQYRDLSQKSSKKPLSKDEVINSVKSKMIISNIIESEVTLAVKRGKVKIIFKPAK